MQVSMSDGAVAVKVDEIVSATEVAGTVLADCTLHEHSKVSIRGQKVRTPFLTARDSQDLKWVTARGINFVAAPFTRTEEDVAELRDILDNNGGSFVRSASPLSSTGKGAACCPNFRSETSMTKTN